ncbi:hypothetical protein E3N88_13281 [Mikania micrantha]|uniref:Cyclic nucleotide-binding domain-containing protein n=1 Tax=Mikania micrantha TaxID=192012 RepID=A0A5N6P9R5_9ASTR|nr:hypothetical protein E3N88_13281 [Mikania micrantha]
MFQFFLRLYLVFKLTSHITQETGVVAESTFAGAVYNILLFLLAAHVFGACYYLLAIVRQGMCWKDVCNLEEPGCGERFFEFGMLFDAVDFGVASLDFFTKYSYCLWWGLRALSSRAEELQASTFFAETHFCIIISLTGLLLLAMIIGTMETYLESRTERLEEYRIQQMDTEEYMNHRQLPQEMKERVPLFDQMDERTVDAMCDRLKPVICTSRTCLLREGDPTSEMFFIMHGHLDSYTTNGGRSGFWNQCQIGPGDFCGEELLTWALDPRSTNLLPLSTRTVTSVADVEAFALSAEDLKFVATQFRKLHNKKLRHTFRVHSHQWRTWAACYIQTAWRRYKIRKLVRMLCAKENYNKANLNSQSKNKAKISETGSSLNTKNAESGEIFESDNVIRTPVSKPKDPDYLD